MDGLRKVSELIDIYEIASGPRSVAVGGKEFVEKTKDRLGYRAEGRKIVKSDENYQLREQQASYIVNSGHKKVPLSDDNTYLWNVFNVN